MSFSWYQSTVKTIHVILFVVVYGNGLLLLLRQVLATQGTGALALQPGADALEIEAVRAVAGQLDDQGIGVVQVGLGADGAAVVLEALLGHAVEGVEVLLGNALDLAGRVVDVGAEQVDQGDEEVAVRVRGRRVGQRRHLLLHHGEERGRVDGGRAGVVRRRRRRAGVARDGVEVRCEGGHVGAASVRSIVRCLDIVLDFSSCQISFASLLFRCERLHLRMDWTPWWAEDDVIVVSQLIQSSDIQK